MSSLVDTHVHFSHPNFAEDWHQVKAGAEEAGVAWVIDVADDLASSMAVVERASAVAGMSAAIGLHPHKASEWGAEAEAEFRRLLKMSPVKAVGEIGLDYHYDFSPRSQQTSAFRAQMGMAREAGLPVIVHARSADEDILGVLSEFAPVQGVWHCFWSDMSALEKALEFGLHIGVGGPITFKSTDGLREVVRRAPLERILLETDAPYLAPVPKRGRRNEPAFVGFVAAALADLLEVDPKQIAEQTSANAARLFGIPAVRASD